MHVFKDWNDLELNVLEIRVWGIWLLNKHLRFLRKFTMLKLYWLRLIVYLFEMLESKKLKFNVYLIEVVFDYTDKNVNCKILESFYNKFVDAKLCCFIGSTVRTRFSSEMSSFKKFQKKIVAFLINDEYVWFDCR